MKKHSRSLILLIMLGISAGLMFITPTLAIGGEVVATGHSYTEEYWSIQYDVLNMNRVYDYGPEGSFSDQYNESATPDPFPNWNASAIYYTAYVNTGGVQTMYMALMNFSWNPENNNTWGTAPFQTMLQHFKTPAGLHVFVENTFAGLVAYQDYNDNGIADGNDSVYFGSTLNSLYHRRLINTAITNELGYSPFEEDVIPTATPKVIEKSVDGNQTTYTFGMDYTNMLVFWAKLDSTDPVDETANKVELVLSRIVAISLIDSINFTYSIIVNSDSRNVTTTTEYDIGPMSELWIANDNQNLTEYMNGTYYDLGSSSLSRYNTTASVEARLGGNETLGIPGFSLGISNWAKIIVLEQEDSTNSDSIVDNNNKTIDEEQADRNITRINMNVLNKPAFLIDFASKPNYTLAGDEEPNMREAPAHLYPGVRVRRPEIQRMAMLPSYFLRGAVINVVSSSLKSKAENVNITAVSRGAFYMINFPEWGGKQINQDPTFVAFTEPEELISSASKKINGYEAFGLIAISAVGVLTIIRKMRKKGL